MDTTDESAPGVTLGYLAGAAIAAALWIGLGIALLPVMLALAVLHAIAASGRVGRAGSHHRWLAAHHLWSVTGFLIVLIAPLASVPALLANTMTIFNTLVYAPHPLQTLAVAWPSLANWPTLIDSGLTIVIGWFVVTLWISIRLLRRGLRWAEGAPAH